MAFIDIFQEDPFQMASMTKAVRKIPHQPMLLGQMNLFDPEPQDTHFIAVDVEDDVLRLIPTSEVGAPLDESEDTDREMRIFPIKRLAKGKTLYAHEVFGRRETGRADMVQTAANKIAQWQMRLKRDWELTMEWHRLGAIQGILYDANGTKVLQNWFTGFGGTQPAELTFNLSTATTDVAGKCQAVIEAMAVASQGAFIENVTQVHALVGSTFFNALKDHAKVRDSYLNWTQATELRKSLPFGSFEFGDIFWHRYRGTDSSVGKGGSVTMSIAATEAKFFPVNAPGVFQMAYGPHVTFNDLGAPAEDLYSRLVLDEKRGEWVKPEVYSYPLHMCTRPGMLQRATYNT